MHYIDRNSVEISTLQDAVRVMQSALMGSVEHRLVLDVRRDFIIKDALKEADKEKFDPKKFVKVNYDFTSNW